MNILISFVFFGLFMAFTDSKVLRVEMTQRGVTPPAARMRPLPI